MAIATAVGIGGGVEPLNQQLREEMKERQKSSLKYRKMLVSVNPIVPSAGFNQTQLQLSVV